MPDDEHLGHPRIPQSLLERSGARRPDAASAGAGRAAAPRRNHPSHGARAVAFASSVAATVAIGGALAYADTAEQGMTVATATVATTPAAAATQAPATPTSTTAAPAAAATSAAAGAVTTTSAAAASSAAATAATGAYADGVYTGTAEYTKWGDVQVSVTIEGGRIVAVQEVQAPSDGKSQAINSRAQPVLEAEAIAAQGSNINAVSGATYTSRTYKASLQAALDQAAQAARAVA